MRIVFPILCISFIISCSTPEKENKQTKKAEEIPDGGPCSYEYDSIPAIILEITSASNTASDLTLLKCFNSDDSAICDTVYYSSIMNRNIENTELEKLNFNPGDSLLMRMGTIIEGHCNPENDYIELQKFKN